MFSGPDSAAAGTVVPVMLKQSATGVVEAVLSSTAGSTLCVGCPFLGLGYCSSLLLSCWECLSSFNQCCSGLALCRCSGLDSLAAFVLQHCAAACTQRTGCQSVWPATTGRPVVSYLCGCRRPQQHPLMLQSGAVLSAECALQ